MGLVFILLSIVCSIAAIWAIASFTIFLFHDQPFNWWSIGTMIIAFVIAVIVFIWMLANDKY